MEGSPNAPQLRAIIYVLGGMELTQRWTEKCLAWIQQRGYLLDSIITEDDHEARPGLANGIEMLKSGQAQVLVVATADYLPSDWVPRFEVAGDPDSPFAIPPGNRPASDRAPRQRRARPTRRT
jgi:hypothetical protein